MRYLTILIFLTLYTNLSYAVVLVGPAGQLTECDYQTIQEALNSGDPDIRIVNDGDYVENINITHSVALKGGFSNCFTALHDTHSEGAKSTIDGSFFAGDSVIDIQGFGNLFITMDNLIIKNAQDTQFADGGHGIDLHNTGGSLTIDNSVIISNNAENGGGIYSANPSNSLSVTLRNTSVFGNSASENGGGIYCEGSNVFISIRNQSLVGENSANNGGGIAATNGCTVTVDSGVDVMNSMDLIGILGNNASNFGGGIYLDDADLFLQGNKYSVLQYGNNTHPVTVSSNNANVGGGIYAENNSSLEVTDAQLSFNTSSTNAAGIYLGTTSVLTMGTSNKNCWQPGKCSVLSHNTSGTSNSGGAIFAGSNSVVNVENTTIHSNRSGFGSVIYATDTLDDGGVSVTFNGNYIYDNADNGNNSFLDRFPFRAFGFVDLNIIHNTIVDNDINDSSTIIGIINAVELNITNSIINNQDETILSAVGSDFLVDTNCIFVNEGTSITGISLGNFNLDFVDSVNHDYRISTDSVAIDTCPEAGGTLLDNEDQSRGWDDPYKSNVFGIYDAGADESYMSDFIFANGFEL